MKLLLLEAAAAALLIASEVFIVGVGSAWLAITSFASGIDWRLPSLLFGLVLGTAAFLAILLRARHVARQPAVPDQQDTDLAG